jgi:hypothetical protein
MLNAAQPLYNQLKVLQRQNWIWFRATIAQAKPSEPQPLVREWPNQWLSRIACVTPISNVVTHQSIDPVEAHQKLR